MTKNLFIIFFLVLVSSTAKARTSLEYYSLVKQTCLLIPDSHLKGSHIAQDNYRAGISPNIEFNNLIMEIFRTTFSSAFLEFKFHRPLLLLSIMRHPSIDKALRECYSNEESIDRFKQIFFEQRYKAGLVATGIGYLSGGYAASLVLKKTLSPLFLRWVGYSSLGFGAYSSYDLLHGYFQSFEFLNQCMGESTVRESDCVKELTSSTLNEMSEVSINKSNSLLDLKKVLESERIELLEKLSQVTETDSQEFAFIEKALDLNLRILTHLEFEIEEDSRTH